MSIHFACEKCGHTIDIGDQFAGKAGHCKHCGQTMTVPSRTTTPEPAASAPMPQGGFKLRPIEGLDVPSTAEPTPTHRAPLQVRPLTHDEPPVTPEPARSVVDSGPMEVLDPYHFADKQKKRVRLNPHYETRFARFITNFLRVTRDRLYLLTLLLLVVILIGFLFSLKPLIHLGTVGVVVVNIAMLIDGLFYLFVLPFRHSLAEGVMVLFPPYGIYYWYKHWDRMRKPVWNTVTAFTPILLAGLAYLFYEESSAIWNKVEQADQVVEKAVGIQPGTDNGPRSRQPSVADQAKQVLGQESNIIQQLAQPQ